jgi:protein-S-isoprenylcysteine O-methyltransferase Ste14
VTPCVFLARSGDGRLRRDLRSLGDERRPRSLRYAWHRTHMGAFLEKLLQRQGHLGSDFLGGPKVLTLAWPINLQKGGTLPFVLALMLAYDNFSPTAWTYAALHGSYGLIWLLKDLVMPDPGWHRKVTVGSALNAWLLVLMPYWLAPVLLVTRRHEASTVTLFAATALYAIGVVLMMGSDAQKYFTLKARPGLITDGFFARVRHPNYLGEMLLYASFAMLAGHWAPWAVLAWVWLGLFLPNMLRKEQRMSRHPGWAAYKARTGFLLPKLGSAPAEPAAAPTASAPPL